VTTCLPGERLAEAGLQSTIEESVSHRERGYPMVLKSHYLHGVVGQSAIKYVTEGFIERALHYAVAIFEGLGHASQQDS